MVYILKKAKNESEILRVFREEKSPLHAMVRLHEYSLTWLISQLYNNQQGRPLQLLPFQSVMMNMLWEKKFPLIIAGRGLGKSFLLGVYALTRALLCPGSEIIIVGAGLRQSMKVFNYIQKLYTQSPLVQQALGVYGGPKITTSGPYINVGNLSKITALPIGDGEKIRGQRSTNILCDEFATLSESIFETVIRPFAAVHADPEERVRVAEFCDRLCDLGADDGLIDQINSLQGYGNQVVLSGTASYEFNHFYKYHQSYEMVIESKGDPKKIQKAMEKRSKTDMQSQFSTMKADEIRTLAAGWKNYAIYKLPYDGAPKGFLDAENVANDKATFAPIRFGMEYECFKSDTKIITYDGVKDICDVGVDDLVLTHKGRFRKVTEVLRHQHSGPMINYKTYGYNTNISVTSNHPYWNGDDSWTEIGTINDSVKLANLKEINNNQSIDIRDHVTNFTQRNGKIFPRCSQSKLNREQVQDIVLSKESKTILADRHSVNLCTIYDVKKKTKQTPKTAIPYSLPLDFDLGLIIGYYASEGSIGANGRAINFSLDGHVGCGLEFYVQQLSSSIQKVFGIKPKLYHQKDNVINVTINQRLIAEFIKNICPGVAHNKMIKPDVLFSNSSFMKGVIVGYWNGDGHISAKTNNVSASSVSFNLACQMRLLLSYFNIASSINYYPTKGKGIINGRSVNLRDKYTTYLYGENTALFKEIFYNKKTNNRKSNYCINDGDASIFNFKERDERQYNGTVYNLEVDEDNSYSLLNATVHNCKFAKDSDGFIKRSLINDATLVEKTFSIELYGDPGAEYVMGLDPARHNDNFGCVVLKLVPGGAQVVYVDAWRKKDSPVSVKRVRDIMRRFNIVYIALDKGGGGEGFRESIGLKELCEEGDIPILPLRDQIDDKRLLGEQAQFILDMVNWTSGWISVNAHALHGDLEHLRVIFPQFPVMEQIFDQYASRVLKHDRKPTSEEHKSLDVMVFGKDNDALEKIEDGAWDNLQAMVDETCAIERVVTPGGVEQFELPKLIEQREGLDIRRRDRFSALVLAAYAARVYRAEARNKKELKSGGSPNSILKRSAKRRRHIQRFGNVMY